MKLLWSWRHGVLGSVVLGAMTTLAVAWASAAYATGGVARSGFGQLAGPSFFMQFNRQHNALVTVVDSSCWELATYPAHASAQTAAMHNLPRWSSADRPNWGAIRYGMSIKDTARHSEIATGWPLRAMVSVHHQSAEGRWSVSSGIGLPEDQSLKRARSLPLRLIPLGFAVNTAVAASAWWLLVFAFPTTRRFLRHRRGACLKCGYGPLPSPDARCPECGSIKGVRSIATPTA